MISLVSDRFLAQLPDLLAKCFQNGILLATFAVAPEPLRTGQYLRQASAGERIHAGLW